MIKSMMFITSFGAGVALGVFLHIGNGKIVDRVDPTVKKSNTTVIYKTNYPMPDFLKERIVEIWREQGKL